MTQKEEFDKDAYRTPLYLFNWLNKRFKFDFDGCATAKNSLCGEQFFGAGSTFFGDFFQEELVDRLRVVYFGTASIFVNPPYSNVTPFLKQAKRLRDAGHTVVVLLNNDKSTQWYQNHVYNVANEVIDIVGGRVNFLHPITGEPVNGNSKGQMVVVFDPTMDDFVLRSVRLDFVKSFG